MPAPNLPLRVLVTSPRALNRAGLVALLRGQPQIEVVGETNALVAQVESDVVLLDAQPFKPQPLPFGFLAILSALDDAVQWLDAGAAGCILDTASAQELLTAIRQVARGETFLSPPIVKHIVVSAVPRHRQSEEEIEPLTERERAVLHLLAQGLSNKDMAQKLYLSVRTIEGHLLNIYGKLRVKSRTEAVLWAVQHIQ